MPQFIGDVFGLGFIYEKQNDNVTNKNYNSWPEFGQYGYFGGGYQASSVSRIEFSNETTSNPQNNLPNIWFGLNTASSFLNGYFAFGQLPGSSQVNNGVFKLDYSNETVSNPGMDFNVRRYGATTLEDQTDAFMVGGYQFPTTSFPSAIRKFTFATETSSNPGANIPYGKEDPKGISSNTYGYFSGGSASPGQTTVTSEIFRLDFSTESFSPNIVNLPQNLTYVGGISDPYMEYGYFFGGSQTGTPAATNPISNVYRMDFSNGTISDVSRLPQNNSTIKSSSNGSVSWMRGRGLANIIRFNFFDQTFSLLGKDFTPSRSGNDAVSSRRRIFTNRKNFGYFAGGKDSTANSYSTINRLDFSTETISTILPKLSITRIRHSASSSNNYGYFAGGTNGPSPLLIVSSADRIDFSSDTTSFATASIFLRSLLAATSSSSYSYFGGGYTTGSYVSSISRLDLVSETASTPSSVLSNSKDNISTVSNHVYAYFGGGYVGPQISTIDRLDFSNEVKSIPTTKLTREKFGMTSISNNSFGYFGGGDIGPGGVPTGRVSTLDRLDFSTETMTLLSTSTLSQEKSYLSSTLSNLYGYFSGGLTPVGTASSINRLDLSTENISLVPSLLGLIELNAISNSN